MTWQRRTYQRTYQRTMTSQYSIHLFGKCGGVNIATGKEGGTDESGLENKELKRKRRNMKPPRSPSFKSCLKRKEVTVYILHFPG